jgi:tagatose-6-phosphate ketose/aldose isomerase
MTVGTELAELLALPKQERSSRGVEFTPKEIVQQPEMWRKTCDSLRKRRSDLLKSMDEMGVVGRRKATVILVGAGSSHFAGAAVAPILRRRLGRQVQAIPTTDLVTHPESILLSGQEYVILHFARSGDSPESLATYQMVRQLIPAAWHLIISCNGSGALARAASKDGRAISLILPEQTNDRSLVMTSSFSAMALAAVGLCFLEGLDELTGLVDSLASAANRIFAEYAHPLRLWVERPIGRVSYLGTAGLFGAMQECRLKMVEMTGGRIVASVDSFLGLRHGPQVFVDSRCAVVASISSSPYRRRYELDMLRELVQKKQGAGILSICGRSTPELDAVSDLVIQLFPGKDGIDDDLRAVIDVVVGQLLALFKSLQLGLRPDNPSASGTISRVVKGVSIYPYGQERETRT